MSRRRQGHLLGPDRAASGLHALHAAGVATQEPGDLGVLDDVDAEPVGGAREAPRNLVVARDTPSALEGSPEHRVAHVG